MGVVPAALALPARRRVLSWLLGNGVAGITGGWRIAAAQSAPLMLAHPYRQGVPVADFGVSEKYDGIRGYWDGRQLWTRGGQPIAAPGWFTAGFPAPPLDGELWAGHGSFERTVSITRQRTPSDAGWRDIRFMVFDLPAHSGPFGERAAVLPQLVSAVAQPWLVGVPQQLVKDHASLQALMLKTVRDGGEGLMLHRLDSLYRAGRSRDLLKYKPDDNADARVLAHLAGQGKFKGLLGALLMETSEGVRFKLGTGFDDALRRDPPAIGSWISYRFRGETGAGIPQFASLLRVRADPP